MKNKKNTNKSLWITIGIAVSMIWFVLVIQPKLSTDTLSEQAPIKSGQKYQTISNPTPTQISKTLKTISYNGKNGSDAMSLLTSSYQIKKNDSNLVVEIDNYMADPTKREYWAFYVNGKLSPIGPADYQTRDTDIIIWKIEKY